MPILGKTPADCFKTFVEALNPVLAKTLSKTWSLTLTDQAAPNQRVLESRDGKMLPIKTPSHGKLFFYLAQLLEVVEQPKASARERWRLRTLKYWYRLQVSDEPRAQALVRWEYEGNSTGLQARHHVQFSAKLALPDGRPSLDLNKLHIPTGWTLIEEVIRFLIHDLGHKPPSRNWSEDLNKLEKRFYEDFTGKGYLSPGS